jgi:hypothetical protein
LVGDAEKDVAGKAAVGQHWSDFEAPTVADGASEADGGTFGNGNGIAVVAAQEHRLLAEVVADAAEFAKFEGALVGVPSELAGADA